MLYYSKEYNAAETTPFIDEDMVVVGAPAILKDKTRMPLSELGDRKLVVPWRPHIFRLVLEAAFISAGIPFTPNIEIDSLPCMKELAHCGDGFTILPPSSVFQEVESGRLACVPTSPEIKLTTVLGQTPGRQPSRAASIVDAELRKLAAELAPRTGWSMTV